MSEFTDDHKELRERLRDPDGYMKRNYWEQIQRYGQAGRLSRWLIRRRYPEVADYMDFVEAQRSVEHALRSAYANEGQIMIR